MSNSDDVEPQDLVRVNDSDDTSEPQKEVPCRRCYETGLVEVQGEDVDCIDCEGYGTVLISR